MQGIIFAVRGHWAQFRKPETNNTPLTHDFITKTALVGLMGAVLGIERIEMRSLFPQLCDDLLYGVQVNNVVKKESWQFTLRNVFAPNNPNEKSPRPMEFLREPSFTVALALQNERSSELLMRFADALQKSEARFTPTLGLQNCPAELEWKQSGGFTAETGSYQTKSFVLRSHRFEANQNFTSFRLGFERIPTFQDNNWWNLPNRYIEVAYPSNGTEVTVAGDHFRFETGDAWCLI